MVSILRYIKHYDASEASDLDDFIKSCEFTLGLARSACDEKEILDYICNVGLGGRAAQVVRQHVIDSFDDIKCILKQRFMRSRRLLEFDLSNMEQQPNETIDDYGSRVESIHYQLIEIERDDEYELGYNSQPTTMRETKWYFEQGLIDEKIKFEVQRNNYETLAESIAGAIEVGQEMKILKEMSDYQKKIIFCEQCHQFGHTEKSCRSTFKKHYKT